MARLEAAQAPDFGGKLTQEMAHPKISVTAERLMGTLGLSMPKPNALESWVRQKPRRIKCPAGSVFVQRVDQDFMRQA